MLSLVRSIPDQLEEAWEKSAEIVQKLPEILPSKLVLCGMGGSGAAGDLLKGLLLYTSPIPIQVIKDYTLPGWIDDKSLAVLISYSGNTEETVTLWDELGRRGSARMAVTSNGNLKQLAEESSVPLYKVPSGLPPRTAIGHLLAPLLRLALRLKLYPRVEKELFSSVNLIRSNIDNWENQARKIASMLEDTFPVIHCLDKRFESVGYRFCCQLNENAKHLAHLATYSEMNHNEIMGFEAGPLSQIVLINLDPGEPFIHPRNRERLQIFSRLVPSSVPRMSIQAEGDSLLERLLSLVVKVDLVSVFLAEVTGIDPMPVGLIDKLKKELS